MSKEDRRDEIILKQYEVIRSMAQHSFDSIASDFWGIQSDKQNSRQPNKNDDTTSSEPAKAVSTAVSKEPSESRRQPKR